ncbi:MAG: hypothetical protein JSW72_01550 [Candidatus Bathyarchaeota archaeon]|nr:MAG: hypothetical protein JSW72_01550 [Candidatus Bathyarchaeota archaeon]
MKRNATICFELPSEKFVEVLMKALLPETKQPTTSRARVKISSQGKKLIIQVGATDTSALRATLNAYLQWVGLVRNTLETVAQREMRTNA